MRIKLVHVDLLSCEAIFRIAPNGDYLIISQCGGKAEPTIENRVHVFRSVDKGESWTDEGSIIPESNKAVYTTEVYVDKKEGAIYVYLVLHNGGFLDWDCRIVKSVDNGKTWVDMGKNPWFSSFVFMRGTIDCSDGSKVIAYQNYDVSEEEAQRLKREGELISSANITHVESGVIRIEKDGTVRKGIPVKTKLTEYGAKWVWSEPTVVELSDGTLCMLIRVEGAGVLLQSFSKDGGLHWSEPRRTDIKNPSNKSKLIKHPDGRIILLNTPSSQYGLTNRFPLEVWVSDDDMKTWGVKKRVSDYPGGYSYPDGVISEDGKSVLFAYEYNRHDIFFVDCEI